MNSRSVGIFAVVVAILVGAAIWFLNSDFAPHAPQVKEPAPAVAQPKNSPGAETVKSKPPEVKPPDVPTPQAPTVTKAPPVPAAMTEDDRKIDAALKMFPGNSDQDHTNTAQALINLLPSLTAEGQTEAAQHISNLLSDEDYGRVMHIWRNPTYNADVLDVFATDLMNREHKVMLPAMLDALKMPNHPFHDDAKSTLEVFLDEDYGNDVGKWEKAMKDFLKKEADEEKQ